MMRRRATGWWDNKVPFDPAHMEDQQPFAEDLRVHGAMTAVRAALQACIPHAKNNGGLRRYRAGFIRFVALAWVCNREGFEERTEDEFARSIGLTRQCFEFHVAHWRRLFTGDSKLQLKLDLGSSPAQNSGEVPRRSGARS